MAVFGLVPAISKWLWVACIVAVGAWAPPLRQSRAASPPHARGRRQAAASRAGPCAPAGGELHTAAREIEARDRMLRQIEADAARRTRNADAARRAAAAQIATLRQRAATQAYAPAGDTPAALPRTQPRSGSAGEGPVMRAAILAIAALLAGCQTAPRDGALHPDALRQLGAGPARHADRAPEQRRCARQDQRRPR